MQMLRQFLVIILTTKIEFDVVAIHDLTDIRLYYSDISERTAQSVTQDIDSTIQTLRHHPELGT